jgi:hypothetical protein
MLEMVKYTKRVSSIFLTEYASSPKNLNLFGNAWVGGHGWL